VTEKVSQELLVALSETAINEVKANCLFILPGIGRLVRVDRKARMGRNLATGEAIKTAAKKVVKFWIAKAADDAIVRIRRTRQTVRRPKSMAWLPCVHCHPVKVGALFGQRTRKACFSGTPCGCRKVLNFRTVGTPANGPLYRVPTRSLHALGAGARGITAGWPKSVGSGCHNALPAAGRRPPLPPPVVLRRADGHARGAEGARGHGVSGAGQACGVLFAECVRVRGLASGHVARMRRRSLYAPGAGASGNDFRLPGWVA
jgi:DNA-binding protein HU-beta